MLLGALAIDSIESHSGQKICWSVGKLGVIPHLDQTQDSGSCGILFDNQLRCW